MFHFFSSIKTLAVYDRFGRLAYGDEELVKNVLEYVIFEKNITSNYGVWRLHDKVVPEWAEPKMPIIRTYHKPKSVRVDETIGEKKSVFKDDEKHLIDVVNDDKKKAVSA
jgi:large subunit ribosomal protein L45